MNAKWLAHLLAYRESEYRIAAMQTVLHQKIVRQAALAARYQKPFSFPHAFVEHDVRQLLLIEARYARLYWKSFCTALPPWCRWTGRVPHNKDTANTLLDIGYHTLAGIIQKKCEKLDIPTEVGLFHVAQSAHARPLVYDLMECFRAVIVDEPLLVFLRKKKQPLVVDQTAISHYVHHLYEVLDRKYYHRNRRACVSLSYWIDLILLEFRSAVSERRPFSPDWMPARHETRCNKKSSANAEDTIIHS